MGKTAAVVASNGGARRSLELELAYVEDTGQDLANLGDLAPGKLQLPQGCFEELKALGVVDADFELGRVTEVPPPLLG
jgi:hypothetical protein